MFTLVECLDCYVIYRNVFGIHYTKRKIPYIILFLLTCVMQGFALYCAEDAWRDIISIIIGFVGAFLLTEKKRGKAMILYPLVLVMYCLVNILSSYILAAMLGMTQYALTKSLVLTLVAESASIIVFSLYGLLIRKKIFVEFRFKWWYACIMLLGSASCLFLLGFAQGVWNNNAFIFSVREEFLIFIMILVGVFMALIVWQHFAKKKALSIQLENEKYRLYLQSQQERIRMLLEDDERRRRLKHDMRAHILALNTYAHEGALEKVQAYLKKMEESFCVEQVKQYTGIMGVDAVIGDIDKKASEQNVVWSFEGALNEQTEISVFEWCTLFSNLLTNALEATLESGREKRIEVKISNIQEKVVVVVRNTCDESKQGNIKPQTTKKDKMNHGLGLKNVEEIVKKQEGTISYKASAGWFEVAVVM